MVSRHKPSTCRINAPGAWQALTLKAKGTILKRRIGTILIHLVGWMLFLALPILFSPEHSLTWESITNPFTLRDLIGYVLLLLFGYANYYLLIPQYYFTGRYWIFGSLILFGFGLVTAIPNLVTITPPHLHDGPPHMDHGPHGPPDLLMHIAHNFSRFAAVFFVSLFLRMNRRWKQTEKERVEAQLSYLKAQINPHFLFNTLNSIYSLALQKSDKTAQAVVKLSGMMRYVTTETQHDFVSLDRDLTYISNYIDLQRIRLGDTAKVDFEITGDTQGKQIAPLILIPFVENAFKHGVNPEKDSNIKVHIDLSDKSLSMIVYNKKVGGIDESLNVGIENTRHRLNLLYPGRHTLTIEDNAIDFLVNLTLVL